MSGTEPCGLPGQAGHRRGHPGIEAYIEETLKCVHLGYGDRPMARTFSLGSVFYKFLDHDDG